MVLEISATPYLFTFKMWDWDRVGLDGVPRPIHLEHARRNIQWDRDTAWTRDNLVGQVETLSSGPGWVEERTGLHSLEFIDVRRHWFTDVVEHDTAGTVNVLNLVEGAEAVVESPTGGLRAVRRALRRDLHRSCPGRPLPHPPARRRRRHQAGDGQGLRAAPTASAPLADRPEGGARPAPRPGCARPDGAPGHRDRRRPRPVPAGPRARRCPTTRPWNRRSPRRWPRTAGRAGRARRRGRGRRRPGLSG